MAVIVHEPRAGVVQKWNFAWRPGRGCVSVYRSSWHSSPHGQFRTRTVGEPHLLLSRTAARACSA